MLLLGLSSVHDEAYLDLLGLRHKRINHGLQIDVVDCDVNRLFWRLNVNWVEFGYSQFSSGENKSLIPLGAIADEV